MSVPRPDLRAVAWDIDGTLIDSEPLHHRALLAACGALGADLSDLPDQAFRGIHTGDVWTAILPRLPAGTAQEDWLERINAHYVEHRHTLMAQPEAVATVRTLARLGIAQVCVSNSCRAVVDANIDALGISDAVAFSLSLDDVVRGKPDPEPYRRAGERLGVRPERIAAVEDSLSGARSARAAGLYVIGYRADGVAFEDVDTEIDGLQEVLALFRSEAQR